MNRPRSLALALTVLAALQLPALRAAAAIPLPEFPRPDFERAEWANLNGAWQFRFDREDAGERAGWALGRTAFPDVISVPFPWGSRLSGLDDRADIGWYRRTINVPASWSGKRVFLVLGACNWLTRGWCDGRALGDHQGGYTPFEYELTPFVKWGQDQELVLRVDDAPRPFKLFGKQGYGEARGIWQTVYLEARPALHLASLHFSPDIDAGRVTVSAQLSGPAPAGTALRLRFPNGDAAEGGALIEAGASEVRFAVPIGRVHLWALDDPYLYEVEAVLASGSGADRVSSYFGMRKVSVAPMPGTGFPYVALNGKPLYLQMTLDQSYHPGGFYTFPSDAFMRDEILRSKRLGLNANRIHIKVEVPRKLYWADRLGLLIMADVPNFWGEPVPEARAESESALRGMVGRDFNHPSIFSWVLFNETWGLTTARDGKKSYLPETQEWVMSMYHLAKRLDPTRLVEDISACNNDHTETDLNSWHAYLPGYAWADELDRISRDTYPGSTWNFTGGRVQGGQPMLNSECGNVWGYDGSTGDVDWSWDYHIMMNQFRRHPKMSGWLYTELHDVINEWNGYYRFDRSEKVTGLDSFVPGMSIADLHRPLYLSPGGDLCRDVRPGESVLVPVFASFLTDESPGKDLVVRAELYGWSTLGRRETYLRAERTMAFEPWLARELPPIPVTMPDHPALAVLALTLENGAGVVLHRNFTTFLVADGPSPRTETVPCASGELRIVRFAPDTFASARWSLKQWNVLGGLKVDGAGHGFFEYRLAWPAGLDPHAVSGASLVLQASAKQLFGKDRDRTTPAEGDYMRGQGSHDPSSNPNAYPMTGAPAFPSALRVRVNGTPAGNFYLPDDPADHRGVLSWHAQPRDKRLREAGSYGYLVQATIPREALRAAAAAGEIVIRLEVDASLPGGLAVYGERFGRYPVDPALIFEVPARVPGP
jgi:hypothetical protein